MVNLPSSAHEVLLSSITSSKLQKIIFPLSHTYDFLVFAQKMREWALIDEQLCGLADRLRSTGCCRTLEAELRFTNIGDSLEWYDFTTVLPKFREKGIVTIIDAVHGDLLLHSSTHSC